MPRTAYPELKWDRSRRAIGATGRRVYVIRTLAGDATAYGLFLDGVYVAGRDTVRELREHAAYLDYRWNKYAY
jgi:hypothetical protein